MLRKELFKGTLDECYRVQEELDKMGIDSKISSRFEETHGVAGLVFHTDLSSPELTSRNLTECYAVEVYKKDYEKAKHILNNK